MKPYNHKGTNMLEATGIDMDEFEDLLPRIEKTIIDGYGEGKVKSQVIEMVEGIISRLDPRMIAILVVFFFEDMLDRDAEAAREKPIISPGSEILD